jgi:hypothetical protein
VDPGLRRDANELPPQPLRGDAGAFDQGVNFAMKQVREALGDDADHPMYVLTVPKRGYRFIAPVDAGTQGAPEASLPKRPETNLELQKMLWANIAELRLAEAARLGFTRAIVPANSANGVEGITLIRAATLNEALMAAGLQAARGK